MSKHAEAELILKLYELRREETLRKARDWFFRWSPQSFEDVKETLTGEKSAYLRMVVSYWDMAAAMVSHGAISQEFFTDTNGEHFFVFAKMEPFLADCRSAMAPGFMKQLEHLIDTTPHGRDRVAAVGERMKKMGEELAKRQQQTVHA